VYDRKMAFIVLKTFKVILVAYFSHLLFLDVTVKVGEFFYMETGHSAFILCLLTATNNNTDHI